MPQGVGQVGRKVKAKTATSANIGHAPWPHAVLHFWVFMTPYDDDDDEAGLIGSNLGATRPLDQHAAARPTF